MAGPVNDDRFMKPVPGYSLTQPQGKWAWDKPPRSVDPDAVVSKVLDNLEKDHNRDQILKLMFAGVSIQEIVNTVGTTGFANGEFSPDVAELIKAPVAIYLMGLADEYDVPVKVFANEKRMRQRREGMDDSTILEIMRMRNPQFAEFVDNGYYDKEALAAAEFEDKTAGGFLAVAPEEMPEVPEEEMMEGEEQ